MTKSSWCIGLRKCDSTSLFQKNLPPPAWSFCHGSILPVQLSVIFFSNVLVLESSFKKSNLLHISVWSLPIFLGFFPAIVQTDQLRWIGNTKLLAVTRLNKFLGPWLLPQNLSLLICTSCMKCHLTWSHVRSWRERYENWYAPSIPHLKQVQQVFQNNNRQSPEYVMS